MTELEKRGEDPNEEPTAVPEGGGSVSFERIQLYLERHPEVFNLGPEIDFHDDYVGEDWPHRGYALARKDVEALLEDAYDNTVDAANAREAANNLLEQKRQWAKDKDRANRLEQLVQSMRLNGAQHHFTYGYQRWFEGRGYVDHCKVCDKDKGHPAHFGSGSRYLDSREVEKAAHEALKRVVALLEGSGFKPLTAQNTARELLAGIPGVPGPIEPKEDS